jgi:hypothetical protein
MRQRVIDDGERPGANHDSGQLTREDSLQGVVER